MHSARILIADDHEILRIGLRTALSKRKDWTICGEAVNGREAVAMAQEFKPHVAVIDMEMPEMGGLDVTRQIKRSLPETEVLIFSAHQRDDLIHSVFEAGALSYIFKADAKLHLIDAVQSLLLHKPFLTKEVSEIVFKRYERNFQPANESRGAEGELTSRERETLLLIAEGKSNKEAAVIMGISVKTVETHRAAIMRKLEFKTVSELVRYALRMNLIQP